MKKVFVTLLSIVMLSIWVVLSGCGQSSSSPANGNGGSNQPEKITIKINNDLAANTLKGDSWRHFKEVLESKLGDKVDVQIYDSSSLYSQSEQLQALQQNNIQFISPVPGVLTGQFPKLALFGLPYTFKSPDMIDEAVRNQEIAGKIFSELENQNVKITNVWLNGWRMLSTRKPVNKLEDIKNLKVRVAAGDNYVETFKALGSNVVTLNWGEVPTALQQGVIDAVEPTPNANLSDKLYEIAPYITNTDHMLDIYVIATNKEWFDSLPDDVKQAVQEALDETAKWNWEQTNKANDEALKTMTANGAHFTKLSDEELSRWEEATKPVIEKYRSIIGEEVLDEVLKLKEKYQWERP